MISTLWWSDRFVNKAKPRMGTSNCCMTLEVRFPSEELTLKLESSCSADLNTLVKKAKVRMGIRMG